MTEDKVSKNLFNLGFALMDFIAYFVPGFMLLIGNYYLLEVYHLIFEQEKSVFTLVNSVITNPVGSSQYGFVKSLAAIVISYILGHFIAALRWWYILWQSNAKQRAPPEAEPFLEGDDKTPEAIRRAKERNLAVRNKCMVLHPAYYYLIVRWYSLASCRLCACFAVFIIAVTNGLLFLYYWLNHGFQLQAFWWLVVSSFAFTLFVCVMYKRSYREHFNFFKRIRLIEEWD